MKKLNFQKSKFCLMTTFILGAFGSLALVACEPVKTVPINIQDTPENADSEFELSPFKNENTPAEDISSSEKIKSNKKPSPQQMAMTTQLLNDFSFFTYLNNFIQISKNSLIQNTDFMSKVISQNSNSKGLLNDLLIKVKIFNDAVEIYINESDEIEAQFKLINASEALINLKTKAIEIMQQIQNNSKTIVLNAIFFTLKNELKKISFIKALNFKKESAINLFALHVDDSVSTDIFHILSTYKHKGNNTIRKIWEAENLEIKESDYIHLSLKNTFHDLINSNTWFKSNFIFEKTNVFQLTNNLTEVLKIPEIQNEDKKITKSFVEYLNSSLTYFQKTYDSFFDLQSSTSVLGIIRSLIEIVEIIDEKIMSVKDFSSVTTTWGMVQNMKKFIQQFKNVSFFVNSSNNSNKRPIWLEDLLQAQLRFKNSFIIISDYKFTTPNLAEKMDKIKNMGEEIINNFSKITFWFHYVHSQSNLSRNLDQLLNFINEIFNFEGSNETNQIFSNFAKIYDSLVSLD